MARCSHYYLSSIVTQTKKGGDEKMRYNYKLMHRCYKEAEANHKGVSNLRAKLLELGLPYDAYKILIDRTRRQSNRFFIRWMQCLDKDNGNKIGSYSNFDV